MHDLNTSLIKRTFFAFFFSFLIVSPEFAFAFPYWKGFCDKGYQKLEVWEDNVVKIALLDLNERFSPELLAKCAKNTQDTYKCGEHTFKGYNMGEGSYIEAISKTNSLLVGFERNHNEEEWNRLGVRYYGGFPGNSTPSKTWCEEGNNSTTLCYTTDTNRSLFVNYDIGKKIIRDIDSREITKCARPTL